MFFTSIGRVVAYLMVVLGALRVLMGVMVASTGDVESARYLGSATTGEAIDRGLIAIGLGISLGVFTDISRSVRR